MYACGVRPCPWGQVATVGGSVRPETVRVGGSHVSRFLWEFLKSVFPVDLLLSTIQLNGGRGLEGRAVRGPDHSLSCPNLPQK